MLKINRLKVEIQTENGTYGLDQKFQEGLNFLASDDNTCGKSSIIEAIYYCLGFEELIGGKGEKVLTSVYKTSIDDGNNRYLVLESKSYLEISNGKEVITLYRTAKMQHRDSKLITVYNCNMDRIFDSKITREDMYVHLKNSATNQKGFHAYLEKFIHLQLPLVLATDGAQRKLYLQLIFSCMFIEQKHGWGDIFSGMPILGIKEAKKRVVEYILNLDTLNNEKKKEELKIEENNLNKEWEVLYKEIKNEVNREDCNIQGMYNKPLILSDIDLLGIHLYKGDFGIDEYIQELIIKKDQLKEVKPKIVDNYDLLEEELINIENDIQKIEEEIQWIKRERVQEKSFLSVLEDNIENVESDLRNNKDAAKLRNLGSKLGCLSSKDICPICGKETHDSLITSVEGITIMSIDENIRHLEAQKMMLKYALESRRNKLKCYDDSLQTYQSKIITLRRLAKALRNDLYSVDDDLSEAIIYQKLELDTEIDKLNNLKIFVAEKLKGFIKLSERWKTLIEKKEKIPTTKFTDMDNKKIKRLRDNFVSDLTNYGYKSVVDMRSVNISEETYLPVIEEFDMKFDSSASDNIRGIWAYSIALLKTSLELEGNHPGVLIFDEPNQHSIVPEDMQKLFESIIKLGKGIQSIIGITIKDQDTRNLLKELEKDTYNLIHVKNKAFNIIEKSSNSYE